MLPAPIRAILLRAMEGSLRRSSGGRLPIETVQARRRRGPPGRAPVTSPSAMPRQDSAVQHAQEADRRGLSDAGLKPFISRGRAAPWAEFRGPDVAITTVPHRDSECRRNPRREAAAGAADIPVRNRRAVAAVEYPVIAAAMMFVVSAVSAPIV